MNDELKMLDRSKCIDDDNEYAGKLLIIKPSSLKEEFRQPYFQYFYAASGFGCYPDSLAEKYLESSLLTVRNAVSAEAILLEWLIKKNCRSGQKQGLTSLLLRKCV